MTIRIFSFSSAPAPTYAALAAQDKDRQGLEGRQGHTTFDLDAGLTVPGLRYENGYQSCRPAAARV